MAFDRDEPTTSEMRHDWMTDRWVIMAPQRTARPVDFVHQPTRVLSGENCPFCLGHEGQTPEAVACYFDHSSRSGTNRWKVRVVPNKFPAVHNSSASCENLAPQYIAVGPEGLRTGAQSHWDESTPSLIDAIELPSPELFQRRNLSGGHEVIIEGPDHYQSLTQLDRTTTKLVFQAYRDRLHYWLMLRRMAYAVLFKNVGHDAGASLVHSHSQLIATDILPTDVARMAVRMEMFYEQKGDCLICRTIKEEREQSVRIVEETTEFLAYCPFASRLPSLVSIVPKWHHSQFELLDDAQLDQLSWLVHRLVRRVEHCHPEASYNYIIYTAPSCQQDSVWFHWRIELFPRLSTLAGFEWGSECFINPVTPETAARQLRLSGV